MNEIIKNDCQLDDPELWQIAAIGWGRVGKPSREAWEAAAQAVSQKVREETIEECANKLAIKADEIGQYANDALNADKTAMPQIDILMAKGQAFAEAASMLRSLKGKANDTD